MTRFVSFNINGIRARQHQLEAVREVIDPDVMGLQETKVHDDQFPLDDIKALGYQVEYFGQKGHYGVALLSKVAPIFVQKGFPSEDKHKSALYTHAMSLKGVRLMCSMVIFHKERAKTIRLNFR